MRKVVIAMATTAAALAFPLIATPQAFAGPHPGLSASARVEAKLKGAPMCDTGGGQGMNTTCLTDYKGHKASGTPINGEDPLNDASEDITIPQLTDQCGDGYVKGSPSFCPFTNHAWDNKYNGDEIFQLELPNVGKRGDSCVGTVDKGTKAALEPCGSVTTIWVLKPVTPGWFFFNVSASNRAGVTRIQALTGPRHAGQRVTISRYRNAVLQLWGGGAP
jgi:hypothetical protein